MNILIGFLYVVEVILALLLLLVVLLQKPKEGGIGGLAGGMGEAVFGADASNVLIKVTVWLSVLFFVNTLIIARISSSGSAKADLLSKDSVPVQAPAAPAEGEAQPSTTIPSTSVPAIPAPATPAPTTAPAPAAPATAPAAPAPAAPAKAPAAPAPAAPAKAPAAPAPAK